MPLAENQFPMRSAAIAMKIEITHYLLAPLLQLPSKNTTPLYIQKPPRRFERESRPPTPKTIENNTLSTYLLQFRHRLGMAKRGGICYNGLSL